jgi:hypothetical protein
LAATANVAIYIAAQMTFIAFWLMKSPLIVGQRQLPTRWRVIARRNKRMTVS